MKVFHEGPEGGRPALLVPGNDLCGAFYADLGTELGRLGMRTALLTLPGFHGQAPLDSVSWTALAEAVAVEAEASGGALIGHSLGGLLALMVAASQPRGVDRLVLMEPALPPNRMAAQVAARRYTRDVVDGDRAQFSNWSGSFRRVHDVEAYPVSAIDLYTEVRRTSDPDTARRLVEQMPGLFPLPWSRIAVPVLFVRGASSGWVSHVAEWTCRLRLKDVQVAVIDNAAHWLANEQDAEVARVIADFCSG